MHDLKHWCSAKAEFQALHDFFDCCEDQNSDVLIDGLFCNDSRKDLLCLLFRCLSFKTQDPKSSDTARSLRLAAVQRGLQHLARRSPPDADDITALLQNNLTELMPYEAQDTVQKILQAFESGAVCCLQLLPVLLNSMGDSSTAQSKGSDRSDSSTSSCIDHIVRVGWQPKDTARVVSILRDISSLGKPQKILLMRRALKAASEGDVQDVPSAAHQILLLGCQDLPAETLQGLIELIQKQETRCSGNEPMMRQLLQVAGTVLLDIEITVKLVTQSKAWVTNLRPQGSLTPFSVAVILTLASVPRLQQAAWDNLKGTVLKALQEAEHRHMSRWMSALPSLPHTGAASIQACTIRALENCAMGWTIIVQPAMTLAFELLDGAAKRNSGFSTSLLGDADSSTATARAAHMGVQILMSVFKSHAPARPVILNHCLARLTGSKEDQCLPYLCLLALLMREQGALVLNQMSCVKALVDLIPFLEVNLALGLMLAIWPLCSEQRAVKEQLIMCLRKAMFRPDVGARLLAVRGFLFLVLQELRAPDAMPYDKIAASSSQVSLSQCDSLSAAGSGASLLQELTGFLRRSLTHQAPVREALYLGMQEIVSADPLVHDSLVELLLPRMCHYFETDQSAQPIILDRCASLQKGEARLNEPFGVLLLAVRAAIMAGHSDIKSAYLAGSGVLDGINRDVQETDAPQALQAVYSDIASRLLSSNLENWGLDSSTDLSAGTAEGLLNHAMAGVLLGSIEVYMEDIISGAVSGGVGLGQAGEQLTSLFSFHQRLCHLATAQAKKKSPGAVGQAKGKKRARSGNDSTSNVPAVVPITDRQPVFSATCLFHLLHMVSEDGCLFYPEGGPEADVQDDTDTESLTSLARDANFQAFVLQSCLLYLCSCKGQLPLLAIIAGTGGVEESRILHALIGGSDWHMMGAQLVKTCQMIVLASTKNASRTPGSKRKEHDPAGDLPLLAVKSMAALLHLCPNALSLQKCMASLPPAADNGPTPDDSVVGDVESRLHHLQQLLLRLVENCYFKEVEIFCGVLGHIASILPKQTTARFSDWAVECCKQEEEMQPRAMKALVGLLVNCAGGLDLTAAQLVADSVVIELGTESDSPPPQNLAAMTKATVSSAAFALLSYLESNLQDLEWLVSTLRSSQGISTAGTCTELEEATFIRQRGVIELTAKLLEVSSVGNLGGGLLRLVLLTYKVLTAAAKLHIVGKGKTRSAPCQAFQDMVTLVLKQLTPAVYEFVTTVQQQPLENGADGSTEAAGSLKNEERIIPDIIFNLEDFEKHLIQISCYGHLNLMRFAKRSTNRDWRTVTRPQSVPRENQAVIANTRA